MSERRIYDGQIEGPDWELIHKAFEDISQWLRDAPTPEMKKYRLEVVRDAFSGKPIINEEYDTHSPPNEHEPLQIAP